MRARLALVSACAVAAIACANDRAPVPPQPPDVPLVALFDDGVLYGVAADGRIFSGKHVNLPEPLLTGARSIAGSNSNFTLLGSPPEDYACAALPSGDVECIGSNVRGDLTPIGARSCDNPNNACPPDQQYCIRLFGPTSYPCVSTWTRVPGVSGITQVHRTCGVDANGKLACWGRESVGSQPPRPVKRLAGEFAILDDGTLYDRSAGALVAGLSNVIDATGAVSARSSTACAVESDGSLWCWGSNFFALVGDGTTTDRATPVKVGDGFASVRIAGGFVNDLACGRRTDGKVACWGVAGDADAGANGIACNGLTCVATPTRVDGIAGAVQVVPVGEMQALVLTDAGRVVRIAGVFQSPKQTVIHDVQP